jgi:hypothetical protein
MKKIVLLLFIVVSSFAFASGQRKPGEVVAAFYKFDGANSQVFNRRNIDARRRWLEFSLYDLLTKELEREAAFLKSNPGEKPHFGDGLPFRPSEELCEAGGKSFKRTASVGESTIIGATATVPVTFAYPEECKLPAIVFQVKLIEVKTQWLITDFIDPAGGSLVDELKRAEY